MRALFLLPLFFLAACAEPKYIRQETAGESGRSRNQGTALCAANFSVSGFCLEWFWEKKPTSTEKGSLIFKVSRPNAFDQSPVVTDPAGNPALVLWMPGMGHGSTPTRSEVLDTGTYRVSDVFFVMPGEWELRFQFRDGGQLRDEAVVPLLW